MEPYHYARIEGGLHRDQRAAELGSARYAALIDPQDQCPVPLGIPQWCEEVFTPAIRA